MHIVLEQVLFIPVEVITQLQQLNWPLIQCHLGGDMHNLKHRCPNLIHRWIEAQLLDLQVTEFQQPSQHVH